MSIASYAYYNPSTRLVEGGPSRRTACEIECHDGSGRRKSRYCCCLRYDCCLCIRQSFIQIIHVSDKKIPPGRSQGVSGCSVPYARRIAPIMGEGICNPGNCESDKKSGNNSIRRLSSNPRKKSFHKKRKLNDKKATIDG